MDFNESGGRQMRKDSGWLKIQNCGRFHTVVDSIRRMKDRSSRWDSDGQRKCIETTVVGLRWRTIAMGLR